MLGIDQQLGHPWLQQQGRVHGDDPRFINVGLQQGIDDNSQLVIPARRRGLSGETNRRCNRRRPAPAPGAAWS
jgi:hypothetical protein